MLSNHALDRYIDRVKPQLTRETARAELEALIALAGSVQTEAPTFAPHDVSYGKATASHFLAVSEGIALALVVKQTRAGEPVYLAVTCLTRYGLSENGRTRRNERAAKRRARRRRRHRMEKGRSNRRDAA